MSDNERFGDAHHALPGDPVAEWLGAYWDGELAPERRAWVEAHLSGCAACRAELDELAALSRLLAAGALPPASLPARTFARQVTERLPHRQPPLARRVLQAGLRYIPLGLFAGWAFCQAVLWVSSGLFLAMQWLPGAPAALSTLLPFARFTAGGSGAPGLSALLNGAGLPGSFPILGSLGLINLGAGVLLTVLFLAWLAGFWSHRRMKEIGI